MTTPTPNNVSAEQISDASIDNTGPTPSRNNAMNDATTTTISMNTNTSDSTHLMPSNQAITSLGGAGGVSTTGAGGGSGPGITDPTEPTGLLPPGAPIPRKDRNLREFLGMMDEYAPIVCCSASGLTGPCYLSLLPCLLLIEFRFRTL